MTVPVYLILGFHSHQPVGNFDFVFEETTQKAYLPLLLALQNHPKIRVSLHYTGILHQWLKNHHPEISPIIQELVNRNQVEMMTGGFYEPILSVIPDNDKQGQIRKQTEFIYHHTGTHPKGFWLAERVWEPQLASYLVDAGIAYTVTDDSHFRSAGLQENETWGYYLTEDQGKTLAVFPISEKLRYTIPFQKVEDTLDYLNYVRNNHQGIPVVVMADDGEKFGGWPGTYDHCYTDGWLENFFTALEKNADWIHLITFQECLKMVKPLGKIYLPTASYTEMMEWAMPVQAILQYDSLVEDLKQKDIYRKNKSFIRGGFWRNFLAKYPESNQLHKKMLRVSHKVSQLTESAISTSQLDLIKDYLYAGQTNCGYWHGIFGGLYLPHLRSALYQNLIKAETLTDAFRHKSKPFLTIEETDIDCDGNTELLLDSDQMSWYFSPARGGALFEEDIRKLSLNLLDTLSRKPEAYHEKLKKGTIHIGPVQKNPDGSSPSIHDLVLAKEPDLEKKLYIDIHPRHSYIDHIMPLHTQLDDVYQVHYQELGDFYKTAYESVWKQEGENITLYLRNHQNIHLAEKEIPFRIIKEIQFSPNSNNTPVKYTLTNLGSETVSFKFGVEFNYALQAGYAHDRIVYIPDRQIGDTKLAHKEAHPEVLKVGIKDDWQKIDCNMEFSIPCDLWRYPVETISLSESGFEKIYQSTVLLPTWDITLSPGEHWEVSIKRKIDFI